MILLVWVMFGVIGHFIGKQKGRPVEGAVLGVLLGPIGWMVVHFGPDYRTEKDKVKAVEKTAAIRVAKDGEDLGLMDLPSIKLRLRSGQLTSLDYYYNEEDADWRPLGSCPLLLSYWANLTPRQAAS